MSNMKYASFPDWLPTPQVPSSPHGPPRFPWPHTSHPIPSFADPSCSASWLSCPPSPFLLPWPQPKSQSLPPARLEPLCLLQHRLPPALPSLAPPQARAQFGWDTRFLPCSKTSMAGFFNRKIPNSFIIYFRTPLKHTGLTFFLLRLYALLGLAHCSHEHKSWWLKTIKVYLVVQVAGGQQVVVSGRGHFSALHSPSGTLLPLSGGSLPLQVISVLSSVAKRGTRM